MQETTHKITHQDGATNSLSVFHADSDAHAVYLILPAMGVRASYYHQFASNMASAGVSVATMDWRGNDMSSVRPSRTSDWGYAQLMDDTFDACKFLQMRLGFARIFFLGHSMGGQVGHLFAARHPALISGVVAVASSDPYCMKWPWWQVPVIYAMTFVVYPFSKLFGYFPGRQIGFAREEAMTVMRDWAYAMRTGYFDPQGDDEEYREVKKAYKGVIRSLAIQDDFLAPKRAIDFTLAKFPKAKVSFDYLPKRVADGTVLTHFNWVRFPEVIVDFLNK